MLQHSKCAIPGICYIILLKFEVVKNTYRYCAIEATAVGHSSPDIPCVGCIFICTEVETTVRVFKSAIRNSSYLINLIVNVVISGCLLKYIVLTQ